MDASITLPEEWFTDSALTANGNISVYIQFLSSERQPVGTVTLIRQPEMNFANDVTAVLRFGTAFHNDLVMIPVHAHMPYSVATFSMFCNISDGLIFERENIVIDSKWNYEIRQQQPTDISIVAMLADPSDVTDTPTTSEIQILFTLGVRVVQSAPTSQKQNFSCLVLYISHVLNEKVQLRDNKVTPQPATVIDNFDNDPFIGEVQIELSQPLAIFPYTQQSHLINTAYFTGVEVSVPVRVLVIYQSGSITNSTADNCTSLTDSLSMNTLCNRTVLTGNETHGDESAIVTLEYKGLVTNVTFRIWFPDSPVELLSTPANLSAIEGWMDRGLSMNSCVQQYQRGKLSAFANFTYSENSPRYEVNIFNIIQPQLVSSNYSVVIISDDSTLVALQPGECQITAGVNILPLTVHVLSGSIQVESLNAVLTTGVSLSLSDDDPYEVLLPNLTASAFLLQDFNTDGARLSVIPGIVFSDGTRYIPTRDITVNSLNQTILRVVEGSTDVTVLGSGMAVLQVTWSPECNSSSLASTNVVVTVDLPDPSHIEISLDSTRITPSGSLASRAHVPVAASLQAFLVYPDGTRADIIADGRLQLDLTQANGLINYIISNDMVIIATADGMRSGIATVMVTVAGHTITTQFNITVVHYRSLLMYATPYPVYNGSDSIRVSQLHQIANTGMFQRALLHMFMTLTDNSTVELVSDLYYESENDSVSLSGDRVTGRSPGNAIIRGFFGGQSIVIEVTVMSTPVVITSFVEFTLGTDTLSGVKNIHTVQFQVSAMFNDSTIHNELLSRNRALYPGLLAFASDVPSAAFVDQFTGVVILRDNHHDFVTVTIETVLSTASATFRFACNLVAEDGDIDIGYQTGIPIPPQTVGTSFNVPIYVNNGGRGLQAFDMIMFVDLNILQFQSGTPGTDFNSSRLTVDELNQDSLSIRGMGMCDAVCDTQQLIHIVDLNFTATNTSLVDISGLIISLTSDNGTTNPNNHSLFVAGSIELLVTEEGVRRKRMVPNSNANIHRIRRQTNCQVSPDCNCAVAGDLNRDCVLDIYDAQFLLTYLAEETYDFQLSSFNLTSSQLSELDVDKNGVVDLSDAYVLERVSLNLLHLLTNVTIIPIQPSTDCTLMVSANFVSRDSTNNNLLVFFDFTVPFDRSFTLQQQFDDSVFEQGQYIGGGKSQNVQGGVVLGEYVSDGQYISRIRTDLVLNSITLNIIQVNQNAAQQSSVSPSRIQPMFGYPDPPFEYPQFEYDLPISSGITNVPVADGFNPFMTFDNSLSTTACMNISGIIPPPVFNNVNYTTSVDENQEIGTYVVTVLAETETIYSIRYTIASGNELGYFAIDEITGNITTNSSLDAESSVTEFTLIMTASLLGTEPIISSNASVFITVTNVNEAPIFILPPRNIEINVAAPVNNTVVELMITDPDTSTAEFSMLTITHILPATSVFTIIGNTVVVSEHLASGSSVNYTVNVTVTDTADSSLFSTTSFSVTIVNITSPYFDMEMYSVNVLESTAVGTNLTTINVIAPLGSTITYNILNFFSQFAVDEQSNQLILLQNLEQSNYQFEIEATVTISGENYTAIATVQVTVQPNTTNGTVQFTMNTYSATVPEGSDNGTVVVQVTATIGNSYSTMITYSLDNNTAPFVINMTTGVIVVEGLLDYEVVPSYTLVVRATGPDNTVDTAATVIININNTNDNPPSIRPLLYPIILLSNITQGSNITSVQSNDPDGNEGLQYELTDNLIANINSRTGVITSNNLTDSLAGIVYKLTITVTDGQFSDTTNLTILVLNPIYNLEVPASQHSDQPILTLADRAVNDISYHSVQLPDEFMLNATTGELYQTDTLVNSAYQLIINVSSPTHSAEVIVNITARSNSAPTFSRDIYQTSLPANVPIGTPVIQVSASDVDINDRLVYSVDSNYSFFASIDPLTGIVNTTECLPSAIQGTVLTVEVSVTDGQLSAIALLNISVTPPVNTTSCDEFNFTAEVDIDYNIDGGGFLVNTDQRQSRLIYSQLFSFLTEQSGELTVSVGNKEDTTSFQPQRLMGETVTAILLNDVVYYDDPVIKVALQVRDVRYSTNVLSTTVQIQVTHPIDGSITIPCTANAPSGTCTAEATLPNDWFTTAANISVQYGIIGNSNTIQNLGSVQVIPRVNYTVNYTVVLIAPARPLYREQQFTIPIVAHAGFAVQSYQLVMTIPAGIVWNGVTVDTSIWSLGQPSLVSNHDGSVTVSFLATLLIDVATTVTREMVIVPTDLAEVILTVQSNAVEDIEYHISCTVTQLTNIFENVLINGAPPVAQWVTRHGIEMQTGTIHVVSDIVMGLFAYSSQSELVYLHTGMQYDVSLLAVRAMGGLQPATPTSCRSSNEAILSVTGNCRAVLLSTTQTEPVHLVNISLFIDEHEAILPYKIWFPVNYSLLVSDNILSPINGWLNAEENCTRVYQQSRVRVESVLTDGVRSQAVDVTAYVTSNLQVLDTSIVMYQDGYITGITPGVTTLLLQDNDLILASSNVTVTSSAVDILSLDTTVVVSISLPLPSSVTLYGTHTVNVLITDVLEFEDVEAYVAVTALLSDSTRFPLKDAPGLLINSLDTNVIVMAGSGSFVVQAGRNSGSGELLQVSITSQNCSSEASVFSQTAFVNVSLPRPVSVSISVSSTQLTKASDAATLIGIRTSITVRVFFTFENGLTQEMTADDRTMYNVSSGLNITLVGNDAMVTAYSNSSSGEQTITVSFSHVDLSDSTAIQIIQASDVELEAHPFPHYPGSDQYTTTTLSPIANTTLWEQAAITTRLLLSDSTRRDISTNTNLRLSPSATPSSIQANIIVSNQVLDINSATAAAGFVEIVGTFGNIESRPLRINISTVPVVVNSIDDVYLLSGRNYITGIRDIGSDQVIVSITLNDSTKYVDLFTSGMRQLPQLLQFATNNRSVLSVNESTGSLTIHANNQTLQTITVTAPASDVSHSGFQLACNLDPDVGDVDLGSQTGLPLDPLRAQSTVNIPVHINAGNEGVASLDIDVFYPPTILQAQGVTLSPLASTNPFVSRINDPPGVVALGGTLDQTTARGIILIGTLHFEIIGEASDTVQFTGNVNTFHDINGILIGEGGAFVAGNVEGDIIPSKRRRTVRHSIPPPLPAVKPRRSRQATCDNPSCPTCPDGREVGDTNFDCVLNVEDVTFTRVYITETPLNFTGSLAYLLQGLSDEQRSALDSDQNGVIDTGDAFYLLRVVFGLLRFVDNHTIISRPPDCTLQINFILYSDGRTLTDGSDATKTSLGVLIASNNASFQQVFNNSELIDGQKLSLSTSIGLIGGIVMANFTGNGTYTVTFSRDVTQYGDIGISLVQVTTDNFGMSNFAREIFLRGRPSPPYTYPGRLEVQVENTDITLIASAGYNPLLVVNSSDECDDISTTVTTPTPTPTAVSTASIAITSTTVISTSSMLSISITTAIPSSLIATTTMSVSVVTPSSSSSVTPSVIDTSSIAAMTTSLISSLSPVSTIISDSSLFLTPSSTVTLSAALSTSSATMPFSSVTPSLDIIPSSVTTSSSTVQVESSTLVTETLSSVVASSTSTQTVSTAATPTPTPTPSITIQFPSITPAVVEGMDVKLLDRVTGNVSHGFTQDYGLLAVPSETVTASLAGYQSQATIEEDRKPATRFRAAVLHHDDRVWRDRNNVHVAFQVHDDEWNTRVQVNTVINMLVTLENGGSSMTHTCRPDENSGICVVNVVFPLEWFDVSSVQQASLTYNTTLIATLNLQPYASVMSSVDQVVVELPSQSIFVGETFTATVYAYTSFSVTGYTLIFESSSNIDILSISIDSSIWSYDSASSNQRYSIAAFSNDPEGIPLSINRILLLTLNLQATQQSSNPSFINGTVESLTTTRGQVVLNNLNSTRGPIVMWTRNAQSTIGVVDIVEERPLVLFAVATTRQMVNTFVLNGVSKTASVSLTAGYSTGQLREVTDGLTCISNNVSVISIDNQCSIVSAGSQRAAYASVTITYMHLSVDVTFKIWFPQRPMQVLLSDNTLNLVDTVNCNISQKATVTVLAGFLNGDSIIENVIVTDYVSPNIISMDPSIANVSNAVAVGLAEGGTEICVERNDIIWGCTNISISSELVSVYDVTGVFINNITISEDPVANSLLINVGYLLEIDGDRAGVAAAVRYTDGSIFILDDGEISLQSLNTALLETEGTDIISRNSGEVQLNITWLPPGCITGVYSFIDLTLSLQDPTSISITSPLTQTVEITSSSDAARHVDITTVQAITVELTYANGRTQDITTDDRTMYTPSSDVLVVTRNNNGVSVTLNDNNMTSTFETLSVLYLMLPPDIVFFTVVRAERLAITAYHYPPYTGSYTDTITVLRLISETGIRQRAALRLVLELSNIDDRIVTTNSLTTFTPILSTPPRILNNTSVDLTNEDVVLSVFSSEAGDVTIEGMFSTSIATVSKTIELSSSKTFVTNLAVNSLPFDTLRGQYNTDGTAPLTVDAVFDDGSRISNLMSSNLPGLLNFTSLNTTSFDVTELGVLSPLANTHTPVVVLVNAIAEEISVPYQFFVNLDPSIGDIDLGNANGAPIVLSSGSSLQVPVYVNTGGLDLGAIQVTVQYDSTILQATSVREGASWQQGIFDYNIDNVGGSVDFGGALMAAGVSGTRAHIFTINFVVTRPTSSLVVTSLRTAVQIITELSIDSNTIGDNTPRLSRAGNVSFAVSPVTRKRSTDNRPATANRISHEVRKKQTAPCVGDGCMVALQGDTNGDGVFDIRDVSYALIYIVEASLEFNSERGMQINSSVTASQLKSLDADLNTVIDIADATFLLKAVFRLVYFMQDPLINPGDVSTNCLVEISVSLTTGTEVPVDDAVVYFDIGLLDVDTHNNFTDSTVSDGSVVTYDKGAGHFGGIIMAQRISNSRFIASINSLLVDSEIGVSILQVTFDTLNTSRTSRTAQLFGPMTFPLAYPYPLEYTISVRGYNFTVYSSHGYNPLISTEIGTAVCIITGPSTASVVATTEVTLSTTEYAVIAVSLVLFVLGILLLLMAIRYTCQTKREKYDHSMLANDFTQEDYYVVRKHTVCVVILRVLHFAVGNSGKFL